jgi:hypothetical protein
LRLQTLQADQLLALLLQPPGEAHGRGMVAEVVKDRTPDVGAGKGSEGNAAVLAVELGRPQQSQQSHLHQIIEGLGAALLVVQGDRPHQMAVLLDAGVAPLDRLVSPAGSAGGVAGHG